MATTRWLAAAGASALAASTILAALSDGSLASGRDALLPAVPAQSGFDVFFTDRGESRGAIYRLNPATGAVATVYRRAVGRIASFSTYYYPSKLYFVSGADRNLYVTINLGGAWQPEEVVLTHGATIRELHNVAGSGGPPELYWSEAYGSSADGKIWRMGTDRPVLHYTVRRSDVGGFWAGHFALDDNGLLYVSTGLAAGARIFRIESGKTVTEVFRDSRGGIAGLFPVPGALYYADLSSHLYRLHLANGARTLVHTSKLLSEISDVATRGIEPPTPTPTRTATRTPTSTRTPTATATRTPSPTRTATRTRTPTGMPSASPTPTPTSTAPPTTTSTPTVTLVPTVTPSPTATPTAPPNAGAVRGRVRLERRPTSAGARVVVAGLVAGTNEDGEFRIVGVPAGSQSLVVTHPSYLRTTVPVRIVAGEEVDAGELRMLAGDVDQSGRIDGADAALVAAAASMDPVEEDWYIASDITADGMVDILDLAAVQYNRYLAAGDLVGLPSPSRGLRR